MTSPPPPPGVQRGGVAPAMLDENADRRPKVVILGAGYAGATCAREIQKKLRDQVDLVIVDKRKASVHKVGAIRAAVLGNSYSDRVLIPNDNVMEAGLGRIVHDSIVEVTSAYVRLGSGAILEFDYLVCATGSVNFSIAEPPFRYSDRDSMKKFYDKVSKKIKGAERILIVGGGPVGVELAGEIAYEYHNKVVNIVHSGHRLLSKFSPPPSRKFFRKLHAVVAEAGINVYLNQKLQNVNWRDHGNKPYISGEAEYITDKNKKIMADLVLLCAGKRIPSHFYPESWRDNLTGQLKVRRTLQLFEHSNVFAIGDLNDLPENKQGMLAARQGKTCAENIKRLVEGQTRLQNHSLNFGWGRTFVLVPVGRKKGAGYWGCWTIGNKWTTSWKGKDLKAKEQWALYNILDVPREVGGPSKGNKLGTVKKIPVLTPGEKAYNLRTRSIEVGPGARGSIGSTTSLADMYRTDGHDSLLKYNDEEVVTHTSKPGPKREDIVSFVGSLDGRGESVNFSSPGARNPAFIAGSNKNKATIGPAGSFALVPTKKPEQKQEENDDGW